jgi:tetratricopeptide (TPR) repeat protein
MPGDKSQPAKDRPLAQVVAALNAELFELQRSEDDLAKLGLDRSADDETVRLAYLELSKRYHPHRFARYRSAEASRLANEIYVCVQAAYGRVTGSHRVPGASEKAKPRTVRTRDDLSVSRAAELIDFHQYDAAAKLLVEVLAANPDHDDARAYWHLAEARKQKIGGNLAAAAAAYRELLELKPNHAEAKVEAERLDTTSKKSVWTRLLKLGR